MLAVLYGKSLLCCGDVCVCDCLCVRERKFVCVCEIVCLCVREKVCLCV